MCPPPRKRRLSAPQLQAQFSRLLDGTRMRRFKKTPCWPKEHGNTSCVSRINGFTTQTAWAIGATQGGSFLDAQFEHGETCSTAEATRGHADPRITTEPRGLTESQSRPADLFTPAVPERSTALSFQASCIVSWFGQQMVGHTQQRTPNVSKHLPAQMAR